MSATPDERSGAPVPEPRPRVPALLVMHADLATALLHAAEKVYGDVTGVQVVSNEGMDKAQIEERIAAEVAGWTHGGLVLTDFWGGSCHTCALAAARDNVSILLLTGVNLPMLIDYLHNRERYGVEELADRMLQRGRDNIRTQRGPGSPPR